MLWGEIVPISKEMLITSGPVIRICRAFGLFPVTIQKEKRRLLLKWSPLYAVYSYAFGLSIIILTYWGYISDVIIGREKSIRMRADTDIYVTFTDVSASVLVHTFGIFVMSFKHSVFCQYVRCLHKIDKIIPPTNLKSARNFSILVMTFILGGLFVVLTNDMLMYFRSAGPRTGKWFIVKCYTAYYIAYHVAYCHKFLFWHLTNCIVRRIRLLNDFLDKDNFMFFTKQKINVKGEHSKYVDEMFNQNDQVTKGPKIISNAVFKLMQVYGSLCDAGDCLNNLLGINIAITLVGVLWHLILVPYFLITGITRDRKDVTFVLMQGLWILITMGRVLFMVQPWYNCQTEVQKTKDLVGNLMSCPNVDQEIKVQLKYFSMLLRLRKIEFSGSGLIYLDRTLVVSMVGSAATHLVVLLEAGGWDSTLPEFKLTNMSIVTGNFTA